MLCSAELAADSTRYKGFLATINRVFYSIFKLFFLFSEDYKQRFLKNISTSGSLICSSDARYDQIIQKAERISLQNHIEIFTTPRPITFIAGSNRACRRKNFASFIRLNFIMKIMKCNFILVPHELHESHLQAIEKEMHGAGITTERYSVFSKTNLKPIV